MNSWILGIVQFLHVISAVIAIGGTFFNRVFLPRVARDNGGLPDALPNAIHKRWIKVQWHAIIVLFITGVVNLMHAMATKVYKPLQHGMFGVKFLLFLALCVVLGLLTIDNEQARAKRPARAALALVLGIAIVLLSTLLRRSY